MLLLLFYLNLFKMASLNMTDKLFLNCSYFVRSSTTLFQTHVMRNKIQLQVLALYKQCLRAAEAKPGFTSSVQQEFRRNAALPKTDSLRIEAALRSGVRRLEMMQDPSVRGAGKFVDKK